METKVCSRCGEEKSVEEFYKETFRKDGYRCQCKKCTKKSRHEYYEKNKDIEKKRYKKYREKNLKKETARQKAWRQRNKKTHRGQGEIGAEYLEKIKERINERIDKYANRETWETAICSGCGEEKGIFEFRKKESLCRACADKIVKFRCYYQIMIDNKVYNFNTCPPELEETIKQAVEIKNLKRDLRKQRKELEKVK